MLSLLYFDVEDIVSPPDHPSHRLPGQFAEIMTRHKFTGGCFHIIGHKVRHMVDHGFTDVIRAIREHDVSLHYDRGSIHPWTEEETGVLPWHEAVSRALFREKPGMDLLMDVFGKCSALTRHMCIWSPPIAYAIGRMGLPFFNGPVLMPGHGVTWFCNNLDIRGLEFGLVLDRVYRDTPKFDRQLPEIIDKLRELTGQTDYAATFGCHPCCTLYDEYTDHNFDHGANPRLDKCFPPREIHVDVQTILRNFERFVTVLKAQPNVTWTNVAEIKRMYRYRPVRLAKRHVEEFARLAVERRGPVYTDVLTAAEGLCLLARHRLSSAEGGGTGRLPVDRQVIPVSWYEVPTVMGPLSVPTVNGSALPDGSALTALARCMVEYVYGTGYLPVWCELPGAGLRVDPTTLLVRLALAMLGKEKDAIGPLENVQPDVVENMRLALQDPGWQEYRKQYNDGKIDRELFCQAWTLKPAWRKEDYAHDVQAAPYERPMILTEWAEYDGHVVSCEIP